MQLLPFFSLALLSQTAVTAFRTSPIVGPIRTSKLDGEARDDGVEERILPPRNVPRWRRTPTVRPLSALARSNDERPKKDARSEFDGRMRLLGTGVAATASLLAAFARAGVARAATPLLVTRGSVAPLLSSPWFRLPATASASVVPTVRFTVGTVVPPRSGREAAGLALLALVAVAALLRSACDGYAPLVRLMAKFSRGVDDGSGSPAEVDWGTYSRSELEPLRKTRAGKEEIESRAFDPRTMMFLPIEAKAEVNRDAERAKLQKAGRFFREKKYEQRRRAVRVARSERGEPAYLETLDINEKTERDVARKGYLDTLSDAETSTWDAYERRLAEARPANEVDELKEEVSNLRGLMQIEQSMYQTSNNALKLAVEAQHEELRHSSAHDELKEFDRKLSTGEELKEFDGRAREYERAIVDEAATNIPQAEDRERTNLST